MKGLFKASVLLGVCLFFIACRWAYEITPTPISSPSATASPAITPSPTWAPASALPTLSFHSTPPTLTNKTSTPAYTYPTPLPTIAATAVRQLVHQNLSVQTMEDVYGYTIRRITGWEYGFHRHRCNGYEWLDSNHLLLYPRMGQRPSRGEGGGWEDFGTEPVVLTLDGGSLWLRPLGSVAASEWECNAVYWSQELGVIINQEYYGNGYVSKEAVVIYPLDGPGITRYWGKILSVSPSGTKILVDDDTVIDLRANKIIDLAWYMDYDLELSSRLYWTSDETRVYRCCFYYADLKTGESYNFEWSDLRVARGEPALHPLRPHPDGQWVRNDTYFFVKWDYWTYAGDPTVLLNPAEKKYYVLRLPETPMVNPVTQTYEVSPDGMQVWITGFSEVDGLYHHFLVDLTTLAAVSYDMPFSEFEWSPDGKFALLKISADTGRNAQTLLLSVSNKKLVPVDWDFETKWRPNDHSLADLMEEGQVLAIFDAKDQSIQRRELPTAFKRLVWSPQGERIALIARDNSLWQIDYPGLESPKQLTEPLPELETITWSPDGQAIALVSGADIYVVETTEK